MMNGINLRQNSKRVYLNLNMYVCHVVLKCYVEHNKHE